VVSAHVAVDRDGPVGWIRLARPEKRNALTQAMREALAGALDGFDADPAIRAAVLTGEGSAFCAGVDLTEDTPVPPQLATAVSAPLERFGKPLLAAVNGPAAGGGFELALACDLRVAASTATFSLPEVKLASLPGSGGVVRLWQAVPPAVAAKLVLTGEPVDAAEALRVGLVSDVVEPEGLLELAARLAAQVAACAPLSLRAAKHVLRSLERQEALELERALWGLLAGTDDRSEGRAAFRERRPPRFEGR
jgi:enoyl-CoA hydratase/carnithine racemase